MAGFKYNLDRILQWTQKNANWITAFVVICIYTVLYQTIVDDIVVQFLSKFLIIRSWWWPDALFLLLLAGSLLYTAAIVYTQRLQPKGISTLYYVLIISALYLPPRLGFLHTAHGTLTRFKFDPRFTYADAIFLSAVLFGFRLSLRKRLGIAPRQVAVPTLLEDDLYGLQGMDILKRTNYARFLGAIITQQQTRSAFAIAIRGDWGSGKSVFLRQLKFTLFNVISIEFNPWLSQSVAHIVPDFFRLLVSQTVDYDRRLSRQFERYSEALNKMDEKLSEKMLSAFGLLKKSLKEEGLEVQAKEIIRILEAENLKIVVFIDDLDRLGGDEIMAVLKLIRNSFNFPNTFFLVACDHEYIQKAIQRQVNHPDKYLEKIFQLEIDLPSFPVEVVEQQLSTLLTHDKPTDQIPSLTAALSYVFSTKLAINKIRNIRDAIRLANSVNHIYEKKCNQVDLVDFLLLEMLKLKNNKIYSEVREALMRNSSLPYLNVPKNSTEGEYGAVQYGQAAQEHSRPKPEDEQFLDILFNRKSNFDEIKSIRFLRNSIRYFSDDLFGNISYTDFDHIGNETFDEFRQLIDQNWDTNLEQLTALLVRASPRVSIFQFKNVMRGLLYISNRRGDQAYSRVLNGIVESAQTAFPSDTFSAALKEVLVNDQEDALAESGVLGDLLQMAIKDSKSGFPDQKVLTTWLLQNLQNFIQRHPSQFDPNVFDIYIELIVHSEQGNSVMNSSANQLLKAYILANPTGYFQEWLIRPKLSSSNQRPTIFVLEPFIDQYLGYDEFERLLYLQEPSPAVTKLQGFLTKFKAENYTECSYDPKVIELFSDQRTEFTTSPTYPFFPREKSIISTRKLHESAKYAELKYAQWVTRNEPITLQEALNGGVYHFNRTFTLPAFQNKITAQIFFLVDDYLSLEINRRSVGSRFNGWDKLHALEIGGFLSEGENEIGFIIENVSMAAKHVDGKPENNPYEFVYHIKISESGG
jgi:hypothetical protein